MKTQCHASLQKVEDHSTNIVIQLNQAIQASIASKGELNGSVVEALQTKYSTTSGDVWHFANANIGKGEAS